MSGVSAPVVLRSGKEVHEVTATTKTDNDHIKDSIRGNLARPDHVSDKALPLQRTVCLMYRGSI